VHEPLSIDSRAWLWETAFSLIRISALGERPITSSGLFSGKSLPALSPATTSKKEPPGLGVPWVTTMSRRRSRVSDPSSGERLECLLVISRCRARVKSYRVARRRPHRKVSGHKDTAPAELAPEHKVRQ
jgi:hypothetical protein